MRESVDRGTFVREYANFKVLTDSLDYVEINNKALVVEKKFKYGESNALETLIVPDSFGYVYQFQFSPEEGAQLKSKHNIYCAGNFYDIPDTIHCELWSYSLEGERIKEIGKAIIF